jgi:hypothetical protein
MFFNEQFLSENGIIGFISKFTHSNYGAINPNAPKKKRSPFEIISIKKEMKYLKENFKFNVIDFINYGQQRGKDWQMIDYDIYRKLMPEKPKKKKFINPRIRRYASPK